jgi:hypothetical protein
MTWSSIEGLLRVLGRGIYDTSSTAGLSPELAQYDAA